MPTKLSFPEERSPNPATNPCVFNNEVEAVVDKVIFVSSID